MGTKRKGTGGGGTRLDQGTGGETREKLGPEHHT